MAVQYTVSVEIKSFKTSREANEFASQLENGKTVIRIDEEET